MRSAPRRHESPPLTRLAIGLAQGIALFLLQKADESKAWPATAPMLYAPLLVCALTVPLIPLSALSAMRRTALLGWSAVAAALVAILAIHAAWVGATPDRLGAGPLSPPLFIAVAALLFIAHHLIQPAEAAGKPVAPYADYFDLVGTNAVRLFLSLAFTGAFWLLLFLAGALFKLIGVEAIQKLIGETAFAFPATGLMFAAAVHMAVQLTEARAGLVRGVRTVGLVLLAWLLPLMVTIAGGFLATLPFTGLAPLWSTKAAASLLLSAAAALIVLINAAYQDGLEPPNAILRWAARAASLLLIPIVILTAYALWLRIHQYGLTPDRVMATTYLIVATGFTVGYTLAALRSATWMKPLERTNLVMAAVSVLLLIALFTPIADPARLSVASQVKRLESGKVSAEKFDFQFLRFDSGRYGRLALERLRVSRDPEIARLAAKADAANEKAATPANTGPDFAHMAVYPAGKTLPASFRQQDWSLHGADSTCTYTRMRCSALVIDIDGDGTDEVLLASGATFDVFKLSADGWRRVAQASGVCPGADIDAALEAGQVTMSEPTARRDILVGGQRLSVVPAGEGCRAPPPPLRDGLVKLP
ncbi:transporter [Caulobacter segnis ATCC 21756]|uniref:Transporter n=1 Tax=Caulobacter segnis (strain ATCC 21756 / DSM 7131 / JCM 7823 / NBRC 15250 / LMG 17158 / TK0059) TaxID=509190 RepID=D5VHD1_CAUST|nr:transporter [Caulobacter segnis ATCC 21756]